MCAWGEKGLGKIALNRVALCARALTGVACSTDFVSGIICQTQWTRDGEGSEAVLSARLL
jgi:hypothetical protein